MTHPARDRYDRDGHHPFDGPTGVPGDPGWTHFCYTCGGYCVPSAPPDRCHYCGEAIPDTEVHDEAGICSGCGTSHREPVFCACCDCALTHAENCWERNWCPPWHPRFNAE